MKNRYLAMVRALCAVGLFCLFLVSGPALADESKEKNIVYTLSLHGSVNPGSADFLARALARAAADDAHALLIELDTPGGLVTSLRQMVKDILASPLPVVVYVAPAGAQAASAGALLTIAAHVAAMSPGTEIGAAHPVGIGGNDDQDGGPMSEKAVNDLAAFARSLAEERDRNSGWAEDAVRKSIASTAREALEAGVIDLVADNRDELLAAIDGREVDTASGVVMLSTAGAEVRELTPSLQEQVLMRLADPNLAYIFIMVGLVGLYFELANPGAIFPGVAGAISLLLGLFALQALPVNVVGLLLLVLAVVFLGLEVFVTSGGVLAISGLIALLVGSLMLFDTPETGVSLSMYVFLPVFIAVSITMLLIAWLVARSAMTGPASGPESLLGAEGRVVRAIRPGEPGKVYVHGELWNAESAESLDERTEVVVDRVSGMVVQVKSKKERVS
ncbi:NfeD family protein [Prosthecochloris ethylica]|nr:nodulation protein NfeD [Prosthecochloris ethylica]